MIKTEARSSQRKNTEERTVEEIRDEALKRAMRAPPKPTRELKGRSLKDAGAAPKYK